MKRKFFTFALAIGIVIVCHCQEIKTDITLDFYETDKVSSLFDNEDSIHVIVEEMISISDWAEDSIELSLENPNWIVPLLPNVFFNGFKLFVRKSESDNWALADFSYTYPKIKCPIPSTECQLKIAYSHMPYSMFKHWYNFPHFNAIIHSDGGWYFSHSLMKVNSIKVITPSSGYTLFLNKPSVTIGDNGHLIDFSASEEEDFSMILIKNHWYQKEEYTHEFYKLNLYHWDSTYFLVDRDTIRKHLQTSRSTMDRRMEKMKSTMTCYKEFFQKRDFLTVNIVDGNLRNNNIIWGCAFQERNWDTMSVFFDTETGWDGNTVLHEILHGFLDILPSHEDSSYYFFSESMTEYLSVALFHSQEKTDSLLQSDYEKRYLTYRRESDGESIFNIQDDFMRNDFSGTALLIYRKTPYILHRWGMSIGSHEFLLNILKQFYAEVYRQNKCSLAMMEKVFKGNGVTTAQWNQLIYDLSHNIE